MKPEQMRIAAAGSAGWKLSPDVDRVGNKFYERDSQWRRAGNFPKTHEPLPAYDTDLNAVAELVSNLKPAEANEWADELTRITSFGANPHFSHWFHLANASAVQRLEAYLKIKHLWID
jgi:hypothetical protein